MDGVVSTVAIIPARGGSKSIPRKNARPLAGHPLVAWSIAAARGAQSVDRVIVSTDDEEIRRIAIAYGAEAPFLRPAEIAEDDTLDWPVFAHALTWLEQEESYRPEIVVQLRPTSPVRPRTLVDDAVARLAADPSADSIRAVSMPNQNPYKMWREQHGYLEPLLTHACPEPYNMPRQRLPQTLWQTGHIDAMRRATLIGQRSMTGRVILPLLVDPRYSADIDTPAQWVDVEHMVRELAPEISTPAALLGLRRFSLLVLDFDGVMTDNAVHVDQDGRETVRCDRSDGLGIAALKAAGFPIVVLSTETNPVVVARCRKLGLPCLHGLTDKGAALRALAATREIPLDDVIYVGNDVNDRACLRMAGLGVVPADAHPDVRREAAWTLSRPGGHGAVRELCDLLLEAQSA